MPQMPQNQINIDFTQGAREQSQARLMEKENALLKDREAAAEATRRDTIKFLEDLKDRTLKRELTGPQLMEAMKIIQDVREGVENYRMTAKMIPLLSQMQEDADNVVSRITARNVKREQERAAFAEHRRKALSAVGQKVSGFYQVFDQARNLPMNQAAGSSDPVLSALKVLDRASFAEAIRDSKTAKREFMSAKAEDTSWWGLGPTGEQYAEARHKYENLGYDLPPPTKDEVNQALATVMTRYFLPQSAGSSAVMQEAFSGLAGATSKEAAVAALGRLSGDQYAHSRYDVETLTDLLEAVRSADAGAADRLIAENKKAGVNDQEGVGFLNQLISASGAEALNDADYKRLVRFITDRTGRMRANLSEYTTFDAANTFDDFRIGVAEQVAKQGYTNLEAFGAYHQKQMGSAFGRLLGIGGPVNELMQFAVDHPEAVTSDKVLDAITGELSRQLYTVADGRGSAARIRDVMGPEFLQRMPQVVSKLSELFEIAGKAPPDQKKNLAALERSRSYVAALDQLSRDFTQDRESPGVITQQEWDKIRGMMLDEGGNYRLLELGPNGVVQRSNTPVNEVLPNSTRFFDDWKDRGFSRPENVLKDFSTRLGNLGLPQEQFKETLDKPSPKLEEVQTGLSRKKGELAGQLETAKTQLMGSRSRLEETLTEPPAEGAPAPAEGEARQVYREPTEPVTTNPWESASQRTARLYDLPESLGPTDSGPGGTLGLGHDANVERKKNTLSMQIGGRSQPDLDLGGPQMPQQRQPQQPKQGTAGAQQPQQSQPQQGGTPTFQGPQVPVQAPGANPTRVG